MSKREYRDDKGEPQCVYECALHHPAVGQLSTAALEQLLLDAAQYERLQHVAALLQTPAVLQLSVDAVTALLLHTITRMHSICCGMLLALPAVQQMPADAVASTVAAAVDSGNVFVVRMMFALDAAAQISTAAAGSLLSLAAQKGCKTWLTVLQGLPQLAELPADQQPVQLSSQQLQRFLGQAVAAGDSAAVSKLCEYAAAMSRAAAAAAGPAGRPGVTAQPSISPADMLSLALTPVQKVADVNGVLDATAAAQLFQLDAATALDPSAVAELLSACIAHRSPEGVLLVARLPAASQLDQQACEDLVAEAVQRVQRVEPADEDDSSSDDDSDDEQRVEPAWRSPGDPTQASISVLRHLLQQPAVQQLDTAAAVRLMSACLKMQPGGTAARTQSSQPLLLLLLLQQLHSQLPAAQQAVLESGARQAADAYSICGTSMGCI
jgi:hypothetical protein